MAVDRGGLGRVFADPVAQANGSERAPESRAGAETRTQAQASSETRKIVRISAAYGLLPRMPVAGRNR